MSWLKIRYNIIYGIDDIEDVGWVTWNWVGNHPDEKNYQWPRA
jgi:hypothetical protein